MQRKKLIELKAIDLRDVYRDMLLSLNCTGLLQHWYNVGCVEALVQVSRGVGFMPAMAWMRRGGVLDAARRWRWRLTTAGHGLFGERYCLIGGSCGEAACRRLRDPAASDGNKLMCGRCLGHD